MPFRGGMNVVPKWYYVMPFREEVNVVLKLAKTLFNPAQQIKKIINRNTETTRNTTQHHGPLGE